MPSLLIRNGSMVTETGLQERDILIENGIVTAIASPNEQRVTSDKQRVPLSKEAMETMRAEGMLIFPGLIDCHVHFREPGSEDAEDMESGAAAALAGGITTVCDMPNTNPPTCTRAALEDKVRCTERIKN